MARQYVCITPMAHHCTAQVEIGEWNIPPPPSSQPPPPPPPPPQHVVRFGEQDLFNTNANATHQECCIIDISGVPVPKALLSNLVLKTILDEHYPPWLFIQEYHGSENFNSIDMILYAFKEFRQQKQAEAELPLGFVNLLDKLEKKCAKAAKEWMEDLNIYRLTNFDSPYHHGFWNTYVALLLHQKADVSITDEGCVTATGQSQKGWLLNLTYCSNGVIFHLELESRRIPVSKALKWPDLLDLPSLGIIFQDQTSIDLAMADMRTPFQSARANEMIERKYEEKLVEGKQQMDWKELVQRLEEMAAGGEMVKIKSGQNSPE